MREERTPQNEDDYEYEYSDMNYSDEEGDYIYEMDKNEAFPETDMEKFIKDYDKPIDLEEDEEKHPERFLDDPDPENHDVLIRICLFLVTFIVAMAFLFIGAYMIIISSK
ncbi:hypothetical protein NEFER03_1830 [Nematocida sp. LUAm3]|nr:hypothetical protein NEFER03_1830 [Nematocida sp. LUAm3]KAI5173863.1 hypothetical protein NEFER02_0330 [Nematocida sp. LUAm2]KAI5177392.1 hypothetical protein NEFER01_0667 [Nematocida sp. LUAm1]